MDNKRLSKKPRKNNMDADKSASESNIDNTQNLSENPNDINQKNQKEDLNEAQNQATPSVEVASENEKSSSTDNTNNKDIPSTSNNDNSSSEKPKRIRKKAVKTKATISNSTSVDEEPLNQEAVTPMKVDKKSSKKSTKTGKGLQTTCNGDGNGDGNTKITQATIATIESKGSNSDDAKIESESHHSLKPDEALVEPNDETIYITDEEIAALESELYSLDEELSIEQEESLELESDQTPTQTSESEVKFVQYPLIRRCKINGCQIEIIEKDYDPKKPYEFFPDFKITDDGGVQIFFEKGFFVSREIEDLPQYRSYMERPSKERFPTCPQGPFKRREVFYPLGFYERAKMKTEYRSILRVSPSKLLMRQGYLSQMNPIEKRKCKRDVYPLSHLSDEEFMNELNEIAQDFSHLCIEDQRKVFSRNKYYLSHYVAARFKGFAKPKDMNAQQELSKHYADGKYRFNRLTGKLEKVKDLNIREIEGLEKEMNKEPIEIKVKSFPFILPVDYTPKHPIAKVLSAIEPEFKAPGVLNGLWNPPLITWKKKKNRIQFQLLPLEPITDPTQSENVIKQLRILAPDNPQYKEIIRKVKISNSNHPLAKLLESLFGMDTENTTK